MAPSPGSFLWLEESVSLSSSSFPQSVCFLAQEFTRTVTPNRTTDAPSRVPEKVITDPDKAPLSPSSLQTAPILGSPVNKFTQSYNKLR